MCNIRGNAYGCLLFRNVCKYTDFFVLFSISATRVEGNFNFSLFSGADWCFVIVHRSAAAVCLYVFYQQVVASGVFKIKGMANFFALFHFSEIPCLAGSFNTCFCTLCRLALFFARIGQQQAKTDKYDSLHIKIAGV